MNQAHLITARDFEDGCPVSAELLGRIYRADVDTMNSLVAGISDRTRSRLAVFLHSRAHTRALGVRVAATCEAALLMQVAGALGEAIYAQSRSGYVQSTYGEDRRSAKSRVSLAGSHKMSDLHA